MLKYVIPIPLQKIIKMLAHPTLPIQQTHKEQEWHALQSASDQQSDSKYHFPCKNNK